MKKLLKKLLPQFIFDFYFFLWSFLGAILYGFPSRKLIVIGVTGTNGKSTTVDLIHNILREAGKSVYSSSSLRFKFNDEETENKFKMTMPGRFFQQKMLRKALDKGIKYAVLEVTSEGIKQKRHKFIYFDIAVITNIAKEHLENHGGFENYIAAKRELFRATADNKFKKDIIKTSIVNIDDEHFPYFADVKNQDLIGYGIKEDAFLKNLEKFKRYFKESKELKNNIILGENIILNDKGSRFEVNSDLMEIKLIGKFNIYNSLAAIAVAYRLGVNPDYVKSALKNAGTIPGRMEIVLREPEVFVDYAHTPDSLEKVYDFLKKEYPNKPLYCILGSAGGGRDKWKRSEMGKLADSFCDSIILTNEDPYDEDPMKIIHEVKEGIKNKKTEIILDRRKAINKVLSEGMRRKQAVVIITGKGAEPWMCVENGKKIPWDDRKIVKEEFDKLQIK